MWWCTSLIPALRRQRQMDLCEFKTNLVNRASSRTARDVTQRNPVFRELRAPVGPAWGLIIKTRRLSYLCGCGSLCSTSLPCSSSAKSPSPASAASIQKALLVWWERYHSLVTVNQSAAGRHLTISSAARP